MSESLRNPINQGLYLVDQILLHTNFKGFPCRLLGESWVVNYLGEIQNTRLKHLEFKYTYFHSH